MEEKIYTQKGKLIIEIPLKRKRHNPYQNKEIEEIDNIAGMIYQGRYKTEMGFVYVINRSYKGKCPDYTSFFYVFGGSKEEFEKLCKKLDLNIVYFYDTN